MIRHYEILQSHIFVARSTAATPPAAGASDWMLLGNCPDGGRLTCNVETKDRVQIVLGQRVNHKTEVGRTYQARMKIEELNKLVLDILFKSNTTATNDFISQGSVSSNVWIQFQSYNSSDSNRLLLQGQGLLIPTGDVPLGGEDFFAAEFEMHFNGRIAGSLINSYA